MNIIKTVLIILFIGLLLHVYTKYLPGWVEKFQEAVLNQPVKKEESDKKEKQESQQLKRETKDERKSPEKNTDEEIKKILGIEKQKEEQREESIIDKIKNYIKMLKSKIVQE